MAANVNFASWLDLSQEFNCGIQETTVIDGENSRILYSVYNGNFVYLIEPSGKPSVILRCPHKIGHIHVLHQDFDQGEIWLLQNSSVVKKTLRLTPEPEGQKEKESDIFGNLLSSHNSRPRIVLVGASDYWVDVPGALHLLLTDHHVCVLSELQGSRHVYIYSRTQRPESSGLIASCTLPSLREPTELLPDGTSASELNVTYVANATQASSEETYQNNPCLSGLAVYPEHHKSDLLNPIQRLCKLLYNELFGLEANLLDGAGLIIGTQDGKVYAMTVVAEPRGRRLLGPVCDLQQPVRGVYALCLADVSSPVKALPCDTLLFVGALGRVAVMTCGETGDILFRTFHIAGPVLCCSLHQGSLVHSTGSLLLVTHLQEVLQHKTSSIECSSTQLHCGNIVALAASYPQDVPDTKQICIVAITRQSQVLHISHDLSASMTHRLPGPAGHEMQLLLSSIGNIAREHGKLGTRLAHKQDVVAQLALSSLLAALDPAIPFYAAQRCLMDKATSFPVLLSYTVTPQQSFRGTHVLSMKLHNNTLTAINNDWCLVVDISFLYSESSATSCSYSVPLGRFLPGGCQEILLELPTDLSVHLPLCIRPVLVYQVPGGQVRTAGVLGLPLPAQCMDLLTFLQPDVSPPTTDSSAPALPVSLHTEAMSEAILRLATGRALYAENVGLYSVNSIASSKQWSIDIPAAPSDRHPGDADEFAGHILSDSSHISKAPGDAAIHAKTLQGFPLSLHMDQSCPGGQGYCMRVSSQKLHTLCQASNAVRARLQSCHCGPEHETKCNTVSSVELRKALRTVQETQCEIASLQEVLGMVQIPTEEIILQTNTIFEKLRTQPSPL